MTWRYQPVRYESGVTLIKVFFEEKGDDSSPTTWNPTGWTDLNTDEPNKFTYVFGNDQQDLMSSLILMLHATNYWEVVNYEDLKVGMTFKRKEY
jgi:hypothetical protein